MITVIILLSMMMICFTDIIERGPTFHGFNVVNLFFLEKLLNTYCSKQSIFICLNKCDEGIFKGAG